MIQFTNTMHARMYDSVERAKHDYMNAASTKPQNEEHSSELRSTIESSSELYYRLSNVLYGETKDERFLTSIRP